MTRFRSSAATAFVVVFALAACSSAGTAGPSGIGSAGPGTSATPAVPRPTTAPSLPTKTDTAWGRIWDGVPDSFPLPTGAVPATDTGQGPSSGQLVVAGAPADIADGYVSGLRSGGWKVNQDGPLEDGSYVVKAQNGEACEAQVSVLSIGDASLVTILYGAGCPFE